MSFGVQNILDGTSNTLLASEVKIAVPNGTYDHRGDVFNDDYNCAMFMAYTTPNSKVPDQVPSYCQYAYPINPPCMARVRRLTPPGAITRAGSMRCSRWQRQVLQGFHQHQCLAGTLDYHGQRGCFLRRLLSRQGAGEVPTPTIFTH